MKHTPEAKTPESKQSDALNRKVAATALRFIKPVLVAGVIGFALVVLQRELATFSWGSVRRGIVELPLSAVVIGLSLTALNYVVLTGYDFLAVRYAGAKLKRPQVVLASTVGYAFSQGLGFSLLTGAPVRYRLYSKFGCTGYEIAQIIAFNTISFWVAYAAVAGPTLLSFPVVLPFESALSGTATRALGGVLVVFAITYLAMAAFRKGEVQIFHVTLSIPSFRSATAQVVLGYADWFVAALVLWVLLPESHSLGFGIFFSVYLIAQIAGVISHVPGGIGVFEAIFLTLIPNEAASPSFVASMLVFRFVYYLMPLLAAAVLVGARELLAHRSEDPFETAKNPHWASQVVPTCAAAIAFAIGVILLLGGAIPIPPGRLRMLSVLPLSVLEFSHFLASIAGMSLVILARGLQKRLDGAYHVTVVLLLAAAVFSFVRGFHASWAVIMICGAGILYASRREFFRRSSLLDEPFSAEWGVAILTVLGASVWLGFFAFKHVDYADDLWWRFALDGDAPRFLRSSVGAAVAILGFMSLRLIRPRAGRHEPATEEEIERVVPIVEASDSAQANLVFLGDKELLFSATNRSFLMYGVSGSSWVVMGDPVGDDSEFESLLWDFRYQADRAGGEPVFYEVGAPFLPIYIDLGMTLYKIGEEARVDLSTFSLSGSDRTDLRQALSRLKRDGGVFEVVAREDTGAIMSELRSISDAWIVSKNVQEKRFSLGWFNETYLQRFPMAVVKVDGRIVAFANLWSGGRVELSIDLMRYTDDAPKGMMDALFTHLILWGQQQGYQRFSLGMAPLSGLETHRLAPVWHRVGNALFRYGEHFYNFQGLRNYKEKFRPDWEERYLAAPPGWNLPGILMDVSKLVSGGVGRLLARK